MKRNPFFVLIQVTAFWALSGGIGHGAGNSVFHIHSIPILPNYFHNLSTAQIEGLGASVKLASRMLHEPGLTAAEQSLNTTYQCSALENNRTHQVKVWASSVQVEFSYTKMNVYISSQYPEGSCPYRVILEHENQHVAINQRALAKYLGLMRQALEGNRSIPTKSHPLAAVSFQEGQKRIADQIESLIQPIYRGFKEEVLRENRKIDTLSNYRKLQARCRGW